MRLPGFLTAISPIGETLAAMEAEAEGLEQAAAEKNRQLAVSTAEQGLALWEADYALDGRGSVAERRARIRAAILGRQVTLSRDHLAELAVTVGGADRGVVEEAFDSHRVTLYALFADRPVTDLSALKEAVERLKPAHLEVVVRPVLGMRGTMTHYTALRGKTQFTLRGEPEN